HKPRERAVVHAIGPHAGRRLPGGTCMRAEVIRSTGIIECVVTPEMCATLDGVAIHPVYSTFWLSYHAEVAARRAIEEFFDEGEDAVGGELCIRHAGMCAVGDRVRVVARVRDVRERRITCDIEAFSSTRRIATGHQVQIVLPRTRIDALVREAYMQRPSEDATEAEEPGP
ncbi:MAG: thioesterase family protein, partial [Candidatus Kapaibacterium sp.]